VQRLTRKLGALDHGALSIDGNNVEYLFANVDPIGKGLRQGFGSHPFSPFDLRCHESIHLGAGRTIPLVAALLDEMDLASGSNGKS